MTKFFLKMLPILLVFVLIALCFGNNESETSSGESIKNAVEFLLENAENVLLLQQLNARDIEMKKDEYKAEEKNFYDMSTEGAVKYEYSEGDKLIFADVQIYGEMFNARFKIFPADNNTYVEKITTDYTTTITQEDWAIDKAEEKCYLIEDGQVIDLISKEIVENSEGDEFISLIDELLAK